MAMCSLWRRWRLTLPIPGLILQRPCPHLSACPLLEPQPVPALSLSWSPGMRAGRRGQNPHMALSTPPPPSHNIVSVPVVSTAVTWGRLMLQGPGKASLPPAPEMPAFGTVPVMLPAVLRPHLGLSTRVRCAQWQRPHDAVVRHGCLGSAGSGPGWVTPPPLLRFHLCRWQQGPFCQYPGSW